MKKKIYLLFLLPLIGLFSCEKTTEKYLVKKQVDMKDSFPLIYDIRNIPTKINSGDELDVSKIKVTYQNKELKWNNDYLNSECYFFCSNENFPTNSVAKSLKITSTTDDAKISFYICYLDLNQNTTFVSDKVSIDVNNSGEIKPWVYFVITFSVAVLAVGMVIITKKIKDKKKSHNS